LLAYAQVAERVECVGDLHSDDAREHVAEAVDAVQREQPADVVHILIVQLGQQHLLWTTRCVRPAFCCSHAHRAPRVRPWQRQRRRLF